MEDYPLIQRVIDAQLWRLVEAYTIPAYVDLVRDFYTNIYELHDESFKVNFRGKEIYMDPEVMR